MNAGLWKKNVLEAVYYLSNIDMQRKGWLRHCDYSSSPDELYCFLFEDENIEEFLNNKSGYLNSEQVRSGQELVREMRHYEKMNPGHLKPSFVVEDPGWLSVVNAANVFYQNLK